MYRKHSLECKNYLVTKRIGVGRTPNVMSTFASNTRFLHCDGVSPFSRTTSAFQSRRSNTKKHVDSIIANLRPMHARGP